VITLNWIWQLFKVVKPLNNIPSPTALCYATQPNVFKVGAVIMLELDLKKVSDWFKF
jgi:hypothetical protein